MTTAEAIEEINQRIENIERYYADGLREYLEVLKMAIEALRKQEAVKPEMCHVEPMYQGWHYQGQVRTKEARMTKLHFCPQCGQAIDGSEE